MGTTKYFRYPFAIAGDVAPVPDVPPGDGSVCYQSGYPIEYQADQTTDPNALDVERTKFNQLMNDITTAVQQYQSIGIPNFITASQNGGVAFPYALYSFCLYDDGVNGPRIFQSKIANNTDLPTVATSWRWVRNKADAILFDGVTFAPGVTNGAAVYWDSTNNRYDLALAGNALSGNMVGIADTVNACVYNAGMVTNLTGLTPGAIYYLSDTTPGLITLAKPGTVVTFVGLAQTANNLVLNIQIQLSEATPTGVSMTYRGFTAPTGFLFEDGTAYSRTTYAALFSVLTFNQVGDITNGSPIVTGLTSTANISVGCAVTGLNIPANTTVISVNSSTQVTLSNNATATGIPTIIFYPYGAGDGSTTFNVPDKRRRVDVGAGGTPVGTIGTAPGSTGGLEQETLAYANMPPHGHSLNSATWTAEPADGLGGIANTQSVAGRAITATGSFAGFTSTEGNGTPFSVMQPSLVAWSIIKT